MATPQQTVPSPPAPAPAGARCHTDQLTLTVTGPSVTPTQQYQASVVLTNISAAPCTLRGFPGVELIGPASNGSTTYDPVRQVEAPSPVLVGPGLNAVAALTAVPGPDLCDAGTAWVPYDLHVTPPDETTYLDAPWAMPASVDNCQGGATHPGTFIGPLHPGTSASPPPQPPGLTGAGPFAGTWSHHGVGMTIDASGTGSASWRTYATCGQDPPPCDTFSGDVIDDGGHATFTVTALSATTASGKVVASADPHSAPVGPMTMTLDPANRLLYWSDFPGVAFCAPETTARNRCGA